MAAAASTTAAEQLQHHFVFSRHRPEQRSLPAARSCCRCRGATRAAAASTAVRPRRGASVDGVTPDTAMLVTMDWYETSRTRKTSSSSCEDVMDGRPSPSSPSSSSFWSSCWSPRWLPWWNSSQKESTEWRPMAKVIVVRKEHLLFLLACSQSANSGMAPILTWIYRVESVGCLTLLAPPLHSRRRKRNAPPSMVQPNAKQFFESINPKGEFGKDEEALETYLYEKSLKIQPKDADKPPHPDAKPKHSSATLRSPGIKPPRTNPKESGNLESKVTSFAASFGHLGSSRSNTYTSRHTSHESQPKTAPPTPGYDTGENRSPVDSSHALGTASMAHGRSSHSNRPNAPPDDSVPAHFVLADVESRTRSRAGSAKTGTLPRTGPPPSLTAPALSSLAPPPILPRRTTTKAPSSAPSSAPPPPLAPPLHPRRPAAAPSSSLGASPAGGGNSPSSSSSTTTAATSARGTPSAVDRPSAFVFPSPTTSSAASPPALPPRRPTTSVVAPMNEASSPNSLGVTLDSRLTLSPTSGSEEASVSPTVSLSMPVPPALPPRRRTTAATETPPPLPPKMNQSPPQLQAPPLPPKTYKRRMHSSSPTNME